MRVHTRACNYHTLSTSLCLSLHVDVHRTKGDMKTAALLKMGAVFPAMVCREPGEAAQPVC